MNIDLPMYINLQMILNLRIVFWSTNVHVLPMYANLRNVI